MNGNIAQPDIFRIWQMDETGKVCRGIKDCGEKWRGLYLGCQDGANTTSLGRLDEHDEFYIYIGCMSFVQIHMFFVVDIYVLVFVCFLEVCVLGKNLLPHVPLIPFTPLTTRFMCSA